MSTESDSAPEITIDHKVTSTLASQLANENLGLRQENIRLAIEKEELQRKVEELEAATGAAKKASSKK